MEFKKADVEEHYMKEKRLLWLRSVILLAAFLVLLTAIRISADKIRDNLELEIQRTLQDVADQNVIAVEREIESKQMLLKSIAQNRHSFASSHEDIIEHLNSFVDIYQFKRMGFVYLDGTVYTTDGYVTNVSYREYFQKGLQGKSDITDAMEEAISEEEELINVFSVPVFGDDGTVVEGILIATYRTERFQDLLNMESFDGNGYSFIVKKNGNYITNSQDSVIQGEANLFDALTAVSEENHDAVEAMQQAMEAGGRGIIKYWYGMEKYLYYIPLKIMNDSQWYIVTTVPEAVISERLTPVMQTVDGLFITMILVAMASILIYVYSGHRKKQELIRIAYEDPLTGGDNYASFQEKMESKRNVPGFLISLDIRGFKIINNTCGVDKGDQVIRQTWEILQKNIMPGECAAHVNADCFVLFLEGDKKDAVQIRLNQIVEEIAAMSAQLKLPRLVVLAGIYQGEVGGEVEKCYGYANQAKHQLKERRDRNYAFYDELDFQRMLVIRKIEDDFDEAIQENRFEVWYQPKYSVATEKPVGAEALVRWRKKDGTLMQPGVFIPLIEKNGMIRHLDDYVFGKVCAQIKEWEKQGKKTLPVSVNISRVSLYYTDIVSRYCREVAAAGLKTDYIQLEITESAVVYNEEIADLTAQFKAAGFKMLLDDFGNGYSSLAALNTMRFDILKLDKSLIDHIGDINGEKLLRYIIQLAQSLGLSVTAEGVEHQEQLEFLKSLGCDDIQGYYFSKPLPLAEYEALLEEALEA